MLNKKKKGFTLIELIAVIAILGVLATVVVPKVGNFTDKAKASAKKADAKSILVLVEAYNAEAPTAKKIVSTTTLANIAADKYSDAGTLDTTVTVLSDLKATITKVTGKTTPDYTSATDVSTLEADTK